MMLIATLTPMLRANSSASKFLTELTRLRNFLRPSSSMASMPMNMILSPMRDQSWKTSLLRSSTSARVSSQYCFWMPFRAMASPMAMPCSAWMNATSSRMNRPGSRICSISSTARSGVFVR